MKTVIAALMVLIVALPIEAAAQEDGWSIVAESDINYTGAPVANGCIGILPWKEPFSVRHVILNHVFEVDDNRGVTRVQKGINPFVIEMTLDGQKVNERNIAGWRQEINMKEATHTTSFVADGKAKVDYTIVALRNLPHSAVVMVNVHALENIEIGVGSTMAVPKEYTQISNRLKAQPVGGEKKIVMLLRTDAQTAHGAHKVAATSTFIYDRDKMQVGDNDDDKTISLKTMLKRGESISFTLVGSVCTTRDFGDPASESERQVIFALLEGTDRLMTNHKELWEELWQGDIEIDGDPQAQQVVRFGLYNLYSYCRAGSALSISPMGLSSQGYNGHIFWDTEIWMYPPMLLLNEGIARSMIDYRTTRLEAARKKADSYGFKGAMFPWESDDWGEESTPIFATTGPFEHHITADVAIACWNYYRVTGDHAWLKEKGFPLMKEAADFWVSRAESNSDCTYSVRNVVGADEYAEGIDDNAFTNGSAKKALEYAVKAAKACGEKAPREWMAVAKGLVIHRLEDGVTSEYDGYAGQTIKQADVNLLGYPLGIITQSEQLLKDLEYYEGKIDNVKGPAMTYSIFCVQYARLGNAIKAEEMFRRCYAPNLRPPFGVLAETPTSQNPYFATCAGGLLQAVINGFGGIDITDKGIRQVKSVLPPGWKKLTIKGVGPERKTFSVENN